MVAASCYGHNLDVIGAAAAATVAIAADPRNQKGCSHDVRAAPATVGTIEMGSPVIIVVVVVGIPHAIFGDGPAAHGSGKERDRIGQGAVTSLQRRSVHFVVIEASVAHLFRWNGGGFRGSFININITVNITINITVTAFGLVSVRNGELAGVASESRWTPAGLDERSALGEAREIFRRPAQEPAVSAVGAKQLATGELPEWWWWWCCC
mmetsp:Transcript_6974/g.20203  ORF Transcript_6974/g.20203 Transcript_6974/m.20203 type:complete len:209 (+) Transcript_6974:6033-6659(+)